jgi:DNA replication licensing factor MCM6
MTQTNVLLQIRGEGLADEAGEGLQDDGRIMYVVHPNCAVDEV